MPRFVAKGAKVVPEKSRMTDRVLRAPPVAPAIVGSSLSEPNDISSNLRTPSEPGRRRCSTWNVEHCRATRSEGRERLHDPPSTTLDWRTQCSTWNERWLVAGLSASETDETTDTVEAVVVDETQGPDVGDRPPRQTRRRLTDQDHAASPHDGCRHVEHGQRGPKATRGDNVELPDKVGNVSFMHTDRAEQAQRANSIPKQVNSLGTPFDQRDGDVGASMGNDQTRQTTARAQIDQRQRSDSGSGNCPYETIGVGDFVGQ